MFPKQLCLQLANDVVSLSINVPVRLLFIFSKALLQKTFCHVTVKGNCIEWTIFLSKVFRAIFQQVLLYDASSVADA